MISKESYNTAVKSLSSKKSAIELKSLLSGILNCLRDETVISQLSDEDLKYLLLDKIKYPLNSLDLVANIIAVPRVKSLLLERFSVDECDAFFKKITFNKLQQVFDNLFCIINNHDDELIKLIESNLAIKDAIERDARLKRCNKKQMEDQLISAIEGLRRDSEFLSNQLNQLCSISNYYMQFPDPISRGNAIAIQNSASAMSEFFNKHIHSMYSNIASKQKRNDVEKHKRNTEEVDSKTESQPKRRKESQTKDSDKLPEENRPEVVSELLQHVHPQLRGLIPDVMSSSFVHQTSQKIDIPELDFSEPDLWGFDYPKSVGNEGPGI